MLTVTLYWKKRKNDSTGYLIIRNSGKTIWEPTGLKLTGKAKIDKNIIESAEKIRAKRLIEIVEQGYDLPINNANKDLLRYYKKIINERPEYERRVAVYKNLNAFCEKNNEQVTFRDLNENFWNRFKNYLIEERKYSQFTIHTVLSILKAVLNRAVRDKVIFKNPLDNVKVKRPKSTRTYLTLEEIQKLKKTPCADVEIKNAFLFDCYVGLRKSDLRELKKENIINGELITTMQKTKSEIRIPLSKYAFEYLPDLKQLNNEDYLFHLPASSTLSIIIKSWAVAAGISKVVTPHTFRHTYATLLITYGSNVLTARDLLGHSDVRETQIYAEIVDELKVRAINNLPQI